MSINLKAIQRFKHKGNSYLVMAFHDGYGVLSYKVQREEEDGNVAPPALQFDPLINGQWAYIAERDMWDMDVIPTLLAQYETRVLNTPANLSFEAKAGTLRIVVEIEDTHIQNTEHNSELLMQAITFLIEYADLNEWDSEETDHERFWSAILEAVAVNYNYNLDIAYKNTTYHHVLSGLLKELLERGYLGPMIESEDEDADLFN